MASIDIAISASTRVKAASMRCTRAWRMRRGREAGGSIARGRLEVRSAEVLQVRHGLARVNPAGEGRTKRGRASM